MHEISRASDRGSADRTFYSFRAQDRLYGMDVAALREVTTRLVITPVPHAPPAVRGLANLRSRILLVLDLRPLLKLPPVECTEESRLMILKPGIVEDAGILVDHGGDIVSVPDSSIEWFAKLPKAGHLTERSDLIAGVCKLENELMSIVDATRFGETIAELTK